MRVNGVEQVELELGKVERIWKLFHKRLFSKRLRQKAISKKIGLPLPLVRAVLLGRYSLRGGKAVIDVPAVLVRRATEEQEVKQRR